VANIMTAMSMVIALITLFVSLVVITFGAEVLVRGASALALRLGVSPLFVGLTIVAFGTSSPELGASLAATARGAGDIAVGNVVGSNIFNIAVILGLAAAVKPIAVTIRAVRRDLCLVISVAAIPWLTLATGGVLPRWLGAAMLIGLAAYVVAGYRGARRSFPTAGTGEPQHADATMMTAELADTLRLTPGLSPGGERGQERPARWLDRPWVQVASVVLGLACLMLGSRFFVSGAVEIAQTIGMSELAIGLTIVAAGTSMPELMTSTVAAIRGHSDLAVGNVIGSNIFNILGILGVCAVVSPQTVSARVLWLDGPVMFAAGLALLPIMKTGGRVSRIEGGLLLAGYAAYLGVLLSGVAG